MLIKYKDNFRWQKVPIKKYKAKGNTFKSIVKQSILGENINDLNFCTRYFEIKKDGYSSLEYHEHPHVVVVIRGTGIAIIGTELLSIKPFDCLYIPPNTYHQLQTKGEESLGFLCIVDKVRDKPKLLNDEEITTLKKHTKIGKVIKF